MVSMTKIKGGHGKYYLEHADTRVDVIEAIGDGLEDYYAGGSEARGEWVGTASREVGLSGYVDSDGLRRALDGSDEGGVALRESPVRNAGYDVTFSAPKSVSVIGVLSDSQTRVAVRVAHDRAVREALEHLERTAAAVRRGHGGERVERASGFVAAAFGHETSRAADPQLHTHVLIANLGRGPDGRWSALDGRRVYANARSASFVYQAMLRAELTRQLGVEWTPVRRGIAEIAGVPKPVLKAFSRRRAQIEAELQRSGYSSAKAAEAAALITRKAKNRAVVPDELAQEWRNRAAELGFERRDVTGLVGPGRDQPVSEREWDTVFKALASPHGLTRSKSTFSRRDVIQALCEQLPAGTQIDARQLEAAADQFLSSDRVVPLLAEAEAFRRGDGRLVPLSRDDLAYSTHELLAREQQLTDHAVNGAAAGAGRADPSTVGALIDARCSLSDEQRVMVERLCLDGDQVAVVAGKAGTGKTYALRVARAAWQQAGHPVLGVAVARRAARELQNEAGIQSTSTVALLGDLAREHRRLPEGCVLVVDEAGMAPTRQLADLLDHVEAAHGKLVLVGDHRQLPELEAGGTFRALVRRGLAIELNHNQRQVEPWERTALDHVAAGRAIPAVALYQQHDRIHVADTSADTRAQLVADWQAAPLGADAVMIAHRRSDVADLNARARALLRSSGALTGADLELAGGSFAVGDRVVVKRNHPHLALCNGERARVLAVDVADQRLLLAVEDRQIELDAGFLHDSTAHGDPTLVHGYAITCHIAQGMTVDHAFVLADDGITRELGYTALSRGRHTNHLYLSRRPDEPRADFGPTLPPEEEPLQRLALALGQSAARTLACDSDPLALARTRHEQAVRDRRALERSRWSPGKSKRVNHARGLEHAAARTLAEARRVDAETNHGRRAFVTERDRQVETDRQVDRILERQRERALSRERGHGIER